MISIIIATYNRAHFILEMLQSVQNQSYVNFECLIIDDGSTDNTSEIVSNFIKNDSRFSYQKRPNYYQKGLPGVRNFGLDICKGNYIIFFDDDDIVHPDNLKISLGVLIDSKKDFCHYQKFAFEEAKPIFQNIDEINRKSLSKFDLEKIITQEIGLASCTVLWQKKCFENHRFKEELMYAEEWECYSRMLSDGYEGVIIDSVLYFNRKHPNSNTGEFYDNNPIRKASKKDAILLVINNLNDKKLLSKRLIRYFVQMSLNFKEFNLFDSILDELKLSLLQKIKWKVIYAFFPLRLYLYGLKKKIIS